MIRINIVDEEFIEVTLVEIQRKRCNNNWYGRSKNPWIFQTRSSPIIKIRKEKQIVICGDDRWIR